MALLADDVDLGRDRDLVARFQNGDPEAFDDLYRRYFDRLRRYCLRHTRDAHEAEEVAQEAFVRALRSMHSLEGERRFYPWMTVIARRITIDRHRKLSRIDLTDEPDLGSVEPDVEHLFAEVDAAHVRAALGNVGPRHREVLLLRESEGMSYAQIATELEVPVTTVEALLHRARKALRREYAAAGGDRRGLFGFPLLAWLTTRAASVRSRLGDRWVEIGAVLTPVAVGAATAAVVLLPGNDAEPVQIESVGSSAPPTSLSVDRGDPMADLPPLSTTTSTDPTSSGAAPSPDPSPGIDAGPVDVFFGPEGTDRARDAAEDMPLHGALGPATGGADPPQAGDHVEQFVDDTVNFLVGTTEDPESGAENAPDSDAGLIDQLLGGNP
jgi:RNA polymerase sigma-70 factor (ECF subfamily)